MATHPPLSLFTAGNGTRFPDGRVRWADRSRSGPRPRRISAGRLEKEAIPCRTASTVSPSLWEPAPSSWEKAAQAAIDTAGHTLRDLRVAEVVKLDLTVEEGKVSRFRTRLNLSFKYEGE